MIKYFIKSFYLLAPALFFLICSCYLLIHTTYDNFGFLKFQVYKLKNNKNTKFSKIYIGDSSGGYSINTNCDNSNSINLCLTGSYGYAGQISFIDIIDEYIKYDTIIVANSIGVASRKYNDLAYYAPYIHSKNIFKKLQATYYSLGEIENVLFYEISNLFSFKSKSTIDFDSDYIVTYKITEQVINKLKSNFDSKQIQAFKKLDDKLFSKKIPYYMIFTTSLPFDNSYFFDLKNIIKKNKINHLLNNPFLLNEINKGDAEEHINPKFNCTSTQYYTKLIK